MREIKCRGWSKDINKWVYGSYFKHCNSAPCLSEDIRPEIYEDKIIVDELMDWQLPNRIMVYDIVKGSVGEYTGLKDKNGKEIYEGDIFNCDTGFCHVVTYSECCFGSDVYSDFEPMIRYKNIKVIGNIYENKDLLESEK